MLFASILVLKVCKLLAENNTKFFLLTYAEKSYVNKTLNRKNIKCKKRKLK